MATDDSISMISSLKIAEAGERWLPKFRAIADRHFLKQYFIAPMRADQSNAIAIARVLCIVGIVYVHAWTGRSWSSLVVLSDTPQGMFRWFLVETIGRSSVPLLGMISGWLVASSVLGRSYWKFLSGKARTVLAPMLLWNALAVFFVCGAVWMHWIRGPFPKDVTWVVDEILGYATFNSINVQMTFLRDLFVCMMLAPLLIRLRTRWLALLGSAILVWAIGGWLFPLFLRPQIPLFFILGICARRYGFADRVADMPFAYAALPFAVMAPIRFAISVWGFQFSRENMELIAGADVVMRLAAAMLVWRTAMVLINQRAGAFLKRFEPYVFLLFCSHMIMIWLGGQTLGKFSGPLGAPAYPLFLLAQPFLALAASILLGQLLMAIFPGAASLLSGGRLRAQPRAARVLAPA